MPKIKIYDHEFYFQGKVLIIKSPHSMVRLDETQSLALFDLIGAVCLEEPEENT